MENSTNRKLDDVLRVLNILNSEKIKGDISYDISFEYQSDVLGNLIKSGIHDIKMNELSMICDYLEVDKKIYSKDASIQSSQKMYKINFAGKVFIENDGYTREFIRKNEGNTRLENLETSERKSRNLMNVLTFIVAIGTIVAAIYYGNQLKWW